MMEKLRQDIGKSGGDTGLGRKEEEGGRGEGGGGSDLLPSLDLS